MNETRNDQFLTLPSREKDREVRHTANLTQIWHWSTGSMRQCISEEVINALANLTYEKKYVLYLDIFKHLDFCELLFERRFKKTEYYQQEKEIL